MSNQCMQTNFTFINKEYVFNIAIYNKQFVVILHVCCLVLLSSPVSPATITGAKTIASPYPQPHNGDKDYSITLMGLQL